MSSSQGQEWIFLSDSDSDSIKKSNGWRCSYQPIRQGLNSTANGKPQNSITEERENSTDQKHDPRRELIAGNARKDPDVFPDIVGDSQHGELLLTETQNGFQRVGVEGEVVGVSGRYLDPNRRS